MWAVHFHLSSMQNKNQVIGISGIFIVVILKAIQQQSSSETEGEGGNTADASSEEEGDRVEEDGKGKRKNEKAGSKRKKSYTSKVILCLFLCLSMGIYNWNTVHLMEICSSSFSILILIPGQWCSNRRRGVLLLCREPWWETSWNTLPSSSALRRRWNCGKEIRRSGKKTHAKMYW